MKNALSLGTFDGVHKGHMAVLRLPDGYRKVAVTFAFPPKAVLSGKYELIITPSQKENALKEIGIDEICVLDFEKVRGIEAGDFLELLWKKFEPQVISCGFNYRFGKGSSGDTECLKSFCREKGIEFICREPVKESEEIISSSYIRKLLKNGEIKKANELLYFPFSFEAEVINGDKRGRTIGFPTVNQKYPEELVELCFGVYKVKVEFDGKEYTGISNIGKRPTYECDYIISETYIKDFSGDLYGKTLKITPLEFLRKERKFSSVEELKNQLQADLKKI